MLPNVFFFITLTITAHIHRSTAAAAAGVEVQQKQKHVSPRAATQPLSVSNYGVTAAGAGRCFRLEKGVHKYILYIIIFIFRHSSRSWSGVYSKSARRTQRAAHNTRQIRSQSGRRRAACVGLLAFLPPPLPCRKCVCRRDVCADFGLRSPMPSNRRFGFVQLGRRFEVIVVFVCWLVGWLVGCGPNAPINESLIRRGTFSVLYTCALA